MKLITFKKFDNCDGMKDTSLIIDNVNVGNRPHVFSSGAARILIGSKYGKYIEAMEDLKPYLRLYKGQELSGKKLLVWRTGGFGDILFLTPLMHRLRSLYPNSEIWFCTRKKYTMIFENNRDVAKVFPMPFESSLIESADYHLHFEGTIEASKNPRLHAVDLFARHAGIRLRSDEKLPIYKTIPALVARLGGDLRSRGVAPHLPKIAIQAKASSPIRTYPPALLAKAIGKLVKGGFQVIVFGLKGHFPKGARRKGVFDLTGKFSRMEDTIAALANCDCLVAPDSSLTHFAAAIGMPCVALYGPFPGYARTRYYPKCITLEGGAPCMPCMLHGQKPCPQSRNGWSPCFEAIRPGDIVNAVREHLSTAELDSTRPGNLLEVLQLSPENLTP